MPPPHTSTEDSSHTIEPVTQKELLEFVGNEVKSELTDPEFAEYVSDSLLTLEETKKCQEQECEKARKAKALDVAHAIFEKKNNKKKKNNCRRRREKRGT